MSLKVNVIYRGIIYRVKGIKVLCSVVLAVIILLVAIVGMGVWMLVTVYDDGKVGSYLASNTTEASLVGSSGVQPNPPSVDFQNTNYISFTTSKYDVTTENSDKIIQLIEEPHFEREPAPDPNLSIFGVGLFNERLPADETQKGVANNNKPGKVPYRKDISIDALLHDGDMKAEPSKVINYEHGPLTKHFADETKPDFQPIREKAELTATEEEFIPHRRILPSHNTNSMEPLLHWDSRIMERLEPKDPTTHYGRPFAAESEGKRTLVDKERNSADIPEVTRITNFSQRSGVPSSKETLTYVGPPVVGYGPDPYNKISKERMVEYDKFWRTYPTGESHTNLQSNMDFKEVESQPKETMIPHLRGLRPSGISYDLPLRPDAQVPPIDPAILRRKSPPGPRINFQPTLLPQPRLRGSYPIGRPVVMQKKPDRKLYVGDHSNLPPPLLKTTIRPSVSVLGPLQEMYDYSKRLAASLLSFNTKTDDQIKETSSKLAQHGIKLIEDYSHIFEKAGGPLGKLSALVPSSEKLKSLDPFQLSLITWTFLDFWEFLIEKVGTLSPEDLELLQERLEKLRRRKDSVMAHALVNETMIRMPQESPRSLSGSTDVEAAVLKHIINSDKEDFTDKYFEEIDKEPINLTLIQGDILGDLFPHVALVPFDNPKIERKNEETTVTDSEVTTMVTELAEERTEIISVDSSVVNEATVNLTSNTSPIPNQISLNISNQNTKSENSSLNISNQHTTSENSPEVLKENKQTFTVNSSVDQEESRMWDPLGIFSSEGRMQFMQYSVKVVFNFGKVFLKKPYALDCVMLLFCKDLNQDTKQGGIDGMAAKVKSVGLKVLTQTDKQLREGDTLGEVWRSVTAWSPLQCEAMFPNCNGPKALEIVNEVAQGSNNL